MPACARGRRMSRRSGHLASIAAAPSPATSIMKSMRERRALDAEERRSETSCSTAARRVLASCTNCA